MRKIFRKIFGIFQLYDKSIQIEKTLKEILDAQIFNSTIANSNWLKNKSFSPGRWAVGYVFLYVLYRALDEVRPVCIIEFGIGQSTKMLSQYSDFNNEARIISYEHDQDWIDYFQKSFTISKNIGLKKANLIKKEYKGYYSTIYDLGILTGEKFQLVLLDGPFGSPRYSRIQVLELIPDHLDTGNFCIMIDDYERKGEQDTAKEICNLLDKGSINYFTRIYQGQKKVFLICSENNKFLASL